MKKTVNKIYIRIIGADIPYILTQLSKQEVQLEDIKPEDNFSVTACVQGRDWKKLKTWLESHGYSVQLVSPGYFKNIIGGIYNRKILIAGILFMILLTIVLPQFILFISIEGSDKLSEQIILDAANNSNFYPGMKKKDLYNDQVKNEMLHALPNLDWIGIDVQGCSAVIRIREKEPYSAIHTQEPSFGNIISGHDGIVLSATAQKGNLMVIPGQPVQKGQLLISGYTDCGAVLQVTRPEGEIIAQTIHNISVCAPVATVLRTEELKEEYHYSLRIGKKLIKLYKDSGIYPDSCVKMYSEEYWELPGGFTLPIAIIQERILYYETEAMILPTEELYDKMLCCAETYIRSQMIAGEVLNVQTDLNLADTNGILSCIFECRESIGIYTNEEFLQ